MIAYPSGLWSLYAPLYGRAIAFEDHLIEAPAVEPLDLALVKLQRRYSSTTLDDLFAVWITAARQTFEEQTSLQLVTARRAFCLEEAPAGRVIYVSRGPVQTIEAITVQDAAGGIVTLDPATYRVLPAVLSKDTYPSPGGVELLSGCWPVVPRSPGALTITYKAGYGDTGADVPRLIWTALLLYVGSYHQQAEEHTTHLQGGQAYVFPLGARAIMDEAKAKMRRVLVPRTGGAWVA